MLDRFAETAPARIEARMSQVEEALGIQRPAGRLIRSDGGPTPLLQAWCDQNGQDAVWICHADPYFWIRRAARDAQARRKIAA
jgi:hypothetical protein